MEQFALRPTIYFGENALSALEQLSGKRVLIVTDDFLAHKSGLMERVLSHLPGCTVETFDRVKPDPSLRLVAEGVQVLRAFHPDGVVAFGGGSPMDCAKAMRYYSSAVPPPLGEVAGRGPDGEGHIPLWCVPTTAGTGSEVTSFAVLTDTDKGVKYPVVDDALLPDVAVLDASLLAGVPPTVTADTGMDVLTHAAEGYVARKATAFTDAMAERAFVLAYQNLPAAHRGDMAAKEQMLLASCLAGIAFNGAGLGINHGLAHALGGRYHVPHGRLNAILMPAVIHYNAEDEGAAAKYARLAKRCSLSPNARSLASALSRLRQSLSMPERLTACGVERSALQADMSTITAAALADVCTPGNPRAANATSLAAIIKEVV